MNKTKAFLSIISWVLAFLAIGMFWEEHGENAGTFLFLLTGISLFAGCLAIGGYLNHFYDSLILEQNYL